MLSSCMLIKLDDIKLYNFFSVRKQIPTQLVTYSVPLSAREQFMCSVCKRSCFYLQAGSQVAPSSTGKRKIYMSHRFSCVPVVP